VDRCGPVNTPRERPSVAAVPNNTRLILMAQFVLVILAGGLLAFWPVKLQVAGSDGSCGLGAVAWLEYSGSDPLSEEPGSAAESQAKLERECSHLGAQHAILGAAVVVVGVIALALTTSQLPKKVPWWDGHQWR
jgi:hypothetical protein